MTDTARSLWSNMVRPTPMRATDSIGPTVTLALSELPLLVVIGW